MQAASFWTYKNFDVFAASRNISGIRWYCRTGSGMTLKAETKQGMRMLINDHLSKHSKFLGQ